jgi:V/A-type H+/Na+-transporting ATPase subunit C
MASGISGYASLNARVRILYSRLLSPAEYAALVDAPDLAALLQHLRATAYGPQLESLREGAPSPRSVVFALRNRLAADDQGLVQTAPDPARRILRQLYRHYELANLKATLRGIAIGSASAADGTLWDRVSQLLFPYGPTTVLPAERMIEASGIAAAVDLLKGTDYAEVLGFALQRFNAEQSLFPLEVALDLHYWRRLWMEAMKLQGLDQRQAMRVIGSLLDMNNLMWAIRYRIYQQLSEEELINYTLPFGYRLRDQDIRAVAAGADIGALVTRLYPALGDVRPLLDEPKHGLPLLEVALKRRIIQECEAAFLGDPFHVGVPLAYLVLHDFELQDLTLLVEAKQSQMPSNRYVPFLSRTPAAHS